MFINTLMLLIIGFAFVFTYHTITSCCKKLFVDSSSRLAVGQKQGYI